MTQIAKLALLLFFLPGSISAEGIPALCVGPSPLSVTSIDADVQTPRANIPADPSWVITGLSRIIAYNVSNKDAGRIKVISSDSKKILALNTDGFATFRGTAETCIADGPNFIYRPSLVCGKRLDNGEDVWVVTGTGDLTPTVLCCPE